MSRRATDLTHVPASEEPPALPSLVRAARARKPDATRALITPAARTGRSTISQQDGDTLGDGTSSNQKYAQHVGSDGLSAIRVEVLRDGVLNFLPPFLILAFGLRVGLFSFFFRIMIPAAPHRRTRPFDSLHVSELKLRKLHEAWNTNSSDNEDETTYEGQDDTADGEKSTHFSTITA